jgi:hypothetical protein
VASACRRPSRAPSESSGRVVHKMSSGDVGRPVGHLVDELEQTVIRPVEVLRRPGSEAAARPAPRRTGATPPPLRRPGRLRRRRRPRAPPGPQMALHPARLAGSETTFLDGGPELRLRRGPRRRSRECPLRLGHLAKSPERDARRLRQRPALAPGDVLAGSESRAEKSSQTSRLLPIPGTPTSVTSCGARSRCAAATASSSALSSSRARRAGRRRGTRCPRRGAPWARRAPRPDRVRFPFARPVRPRGARSRARSPRVASSTRIPSGGGRLAAVKRC